MMTVWALLALLVVVNLVSLLTALRRGRVGEPPRTPDWTVDQLPSSPYRGIFP